MGLFGLFKKKDDPDKQFYDVDPYEVIFLISQIGTVWGKPHITVNFQSQVPDYQFSQKTYDKLIDLGWITPVLDLNSVKKPTVDILKKICKENGLIQSGPKDTIAKRLFDNLSVDELYAAGIPKTAALSEKGEKILKANPHLSYIYENLNFFTCDLYRLQRFRLKNRDLLAGEVLVEGLRIDDFSYPDYSWCETEGGIKYADREAQEIAEFKYDRAIELVKKDFLMD